VYEIQVEYLDYQNIKRDSNVTTGEVELGASQGISFGARFHSVLSMCILHRFNSDYSRQTTGIGFKMYVPGFFMFGGQMSNLVSSINRKNFLTYLAFEIAQTSVKDPGTRVETDFIESTPRFGAELGHLWGVYMFVSVGMANYLGDYNLVTSGGIGYHF